MFLFAIFFSLSLKCIFLCWKLELNESLRGFRLQYIIIIIKTMEYCELLLFVILVNLNGDFEMELLCFCEVLVVKTGFYRWLRLTNQYSYSSWIIHHFQSQWVKFDSFQEIKFPKNSQIQKNKKILMKQRNAFKSN
jgi:hypothetical protein